MQFLAGWNASGSGREPASPTGRLICPGTRGRYTGNWWSVGAAYIRPARDSQGGGFSLPHARARIYAGLRVRQHSPAHSRAAAHAPMRENPAGGAIVNICDNPPPVCASERI